MRAQIGHPDSVFLVAEEGGQIFRRLTSGKVQQYGALLFGATAIFAGALILFV